MKYTSSQQTNNLGYSFVEVLVAIAVLLLGIVGPLTIASKGLQNALFAREQNTAFFLAQEGIEAMQYLRSSQALSDFDAGSNGATTWDWVDSLPADCFSAGVGCGFRMSDNGITTTVFTCDSSSNDCNLSYNKDTTRFVFRDRDGVGTLSPYTRRLYFETVSSNAIKVRSIVYWNATAYGGKEKQVELETVIYDVYGNEFSS